jgi:hypothetical protein
VRKGRIEAVQASLPTEVLASPYLICLAEYPSGRQQPEGPLLADTAEKVFWGDERKI